MLTSDLGLLHDPVFGNISRTFQKDFDTFGQKFAEVWCKSINLNHTIYCPWRLIPTVKLIHRDMGPLSRYLGPDVPKERYIWQDPLPEVNCTQIDDQDVQNLKQQILAAPGLNVSNLVTTAWGSASTFRISDKRGGANGARINLKPQNAFAANNPGRLNVVLPAVSCTSSG